MAENIHSSAFYTWQPSYGSIGDPNEDLTEDKVDDSQEPEEPQFNPSQDPLSSSSSISSQPDITTYSSLDTFIPDVSNNYRKGNIDLLIIIELFILIQNEINILNSSFICLFSIHTCVKVCFCRWCQVCSSQQTIMSSTSSQEPQLFPFTMTLQA